MADTVRAGKPRPSVDPLDRLVARLDLSCPALAPARSALEADSRLALDLIVTHFRTRRQPAYLFEAGAAAAFRDEETLREAGQVLDHEILGHRFGPAIDWRFNATDRTSRDSEWTWSLARHGFWLPLARAYAMTGDERYVREVVSQLVGFVAAWPVEPHMDILQANMGYPGDAWRSIEAAIRIYTVWLPAMALLRQSPAWHPEAWICFLNSIHDHAEFLCTHYSNHLRCGNWATMESSALFQMGVMFPELKGSGRWKSLGYRRFTHELRYQFDHHGVHIERTPLYHMVAAVTFLQGYLLAERNGIPMPPYARPILERSAEFLLRLAKPDMSIPMIGDADRVSFVDRKADRSPYEGMNLTYDPVDLNELRAFFATMARLTNRDDFRFFATNGRQGSPPEQRCFAMPDPGYYVFRSGWTGSDTYSLVTGTAVERGSNSAHSHRDAGHLELHVAGEDVLVDTGRYLYGNCSWKDWWQYFASTRAHNTVQVDDYRMGSAPDTADEVRSLRAFCHDVRSSPEFDVVEISHNGYCHMPEPVFHRRRVLHIKPAVWLIDDILTGIGEHTYRLYFNFAPGQLHPDKDGLSYTYQGRSVRVRCSPALRVGLGARVFRGSEDPKAGWISYAYSVKEPIHQLEYERRGALPARFITALTVEDLGAVRLDGPGDEKEVVLRVRSGENTRRVRLGIEDFAIDELETPGLETPHPEELARRPGQLPGRFQNSS
jgi:hypothetical protein